MVSSVTHTGVSSSTTSSQPPSYLDKSRATHRFHIACSWLLVADSHYVNEYVVGKAVGSKPCSNNLDETSPVLWVPAICIRGVELNYHVSQADPYGEDVSTGKRTIRICQAAMLLEAAR